MKRHARTVRSRSVGRPAPVATPSESPTFTASVAKKEFGKVLELAMRGGRVIITKHAMPKAVVLSVDDFTALTRSLSLFSRGFLLTKRDIDWLESQYLRKSGLDRSDPRVSPALTESLSGLAPALIAIAGFDPLRDEGESYAAALRAGGTAVDLRYKGSLTHGFANLFQLGGDSLVATNEMISALRAHLSRI